ncbi:MAG: OmpH family outer membrane protein [Balneolaceae bacterium]|jgi:outer membrane protein|nr:MAG: OmpH family outer membrane protein [Balneolaceae bacterium]
MKKIIIVTLFLMIPTLVSAQLRVGIMSPDDVLDAMPEAAQVQSQLENFIQQRQNSFQTRYQEWIAELTEYAELMENGTMSDAEQRRREEALAEKQEELNSLQQRIENQIQQRQAELFNPLLVKVEEAMAEVSEELGLDFVLNKTSNTGDPIVYYASQRAADITQRVIQKLTQN